MAKYVLILLLLKISSDTLASFRQDISFSEWKDMFVAPRISLFANSSVRMELWKLSLKILSQQKRSESKLFRYSNNALWQPSLLLLVACYYAFEERYFNQKVQFCYRSSKLLSIQLEFSEEVAQWFFDHRLFSRILSSFQNCFNCNGWNLIKWNAVSSNSLNWKQK